MIDAVSSLEQVIAKLRPKTKFDIEQYPALIFAFDEALILTKSIEPTTVWKKATLFTELRRVLRSIRRASVFSLFLSTAGSTFDCGVGNELDDSWRVQAGVYKIPHPFADLGFDMFALNFVSQTPLLLSFFASIEYITSLGRPL